MSSQMNFNPNYKTGICKYAHIGCKHQDKCWYAHNKDELRYRICVNGLNCLNRLNCPYVHPNQEIDKNEYYMKTLLKSDILGIDKNMVKRELECLNNKFIIDIDTSDDENEDNIETISQILDDTLKSLNNMSINDNENDKDLEKHIINFTNEWNRDSGQFYELKNTNKNINLNINANEFEIERLLKYLKMMNINFELKD